MTSNRNSCEMPPLAEMRIGYVVNRYPVYSQTFVITEILAHEAAGVAVEIFALTPSRDSHFQDILAAVQAPVHYLLPEDRTESSLWSDLTTTAALHPQVWKELDSAAGEDAMHLHQALVLSRMIAARGITHLHAHFASASTTVAMLASRFTGVPYSFTAHAKDIFHEDVQPQVMRRKLYEALAVVTVSDYNAAFLRQSFGADASRVRRIYNGLDLERLPFISPAERPPKIIAVGRLVEKKGFDVLIAACATLRDRQVPFTCEIVGDGALEGALRGMIGDLHLKDKVRLVGFLPQAAAFEVVQSGAVFAAPCIVGRDGNRDGLPTVLLEAMALGTPCISTDVTGIPEIIRHGETGLTVPQGDAPGLATSLERLLADAALRVGLATAARRLIETEFDTTRNTETLRQLFVCTRASTIRSTHPSHP